MDQMLEYALRIAPGLVLVASLLLLVPRHELVARTCIHIGLFIFVRDAMTPVGLWHIAADPVPTIRFSRDLFVLFTLTATTLCLVLATTRLERGLSERVVWSSGSKLQAIVLGAACALLIAAPGVALAWHSPVTGSFAAAELTALLAFCLIGNAYEELLFRGFLQGLLRERMSDARAAWVSGLAFAFGHVPLATSVTSVGATLLIFTAYEGLICALLYRKTGLLGATIAHGGGIFLIAVRNA